MPKRTYLHFCKTHEWEQAYLYRKLTGKTVFLCVKCEEERNKRLSNVRSISRREKKPKGKRPYNSKSITSVGIDALAKEVTKEKT